MAKIVHSLFFLSLLFTSAFSTPTAPAAACSTHKFPNNHKTFTACNDLPVLNSTIYWNYFPSNNTIELAFRETLLGESRWAAWAINPTSKCMIGSQALVAFQRSDGSMAVYTSPINSYNTHLEQGNLTFPVYTLSAVCENRDITIFATIVLPSNVTTVNQLWQQGPLVHGDTPGMHSMSRPNVQSYSTLDFLSGRVQATGTQLSSVSNMKLAHGMINTLSWGILMPAGAIVARNFKGFGPAWFYVHVSCQILGYLGGVAGSMTGIMLGHKSPGIEYKGHKCIGMMLMVLATVQVLVGMFMRPKPDGKYRWMWNLFHYVFGYTTIILGIINIFKGFDILQPPKSWRHAYIGVLAVLVFVGVAGAAFTQWNSKRTTLAADTKLEQRTDENV